MADDKNKNPRDAEAPEPARKPDEDPVGKVYDSRLAVRLARYVRPHWLQAAIASLSVSLKSVCDVFGPIMVMMAIDRYLAPNAKGEVANSALAHWLANNSPIARVLPDDKFAGITTLAAMYLAALVAAYIFAFIQTYLMQWMGQKIMFDLRREIFRHMQRMHVGFFDVNAVGRLVTRLTSDVDAVNDMFTDGILSIVNDFFMLVIMATVMLRVLNGSGKLRIPARRPSVWRSGTVATRLEFRASAIAPENPLTMAAMSRSSPTAARSSSIGPRSGPRRDTCT